MAIERPIEGEYGAYYGGYIKRVPPSADVLQMLQEQIQLVRERFLSLTPAQLQFRFAPQEWSVLEMLGHLCDTEQIMAYRAMCLARNERLPLAGFDQDLYVQASNFDEQSSLELVQRFEYLRRANLLMIRNFSPEMLLRSGTVSENPMTVRAIVYILAGHVLHHLESLENDYLNNFKV